jgi:hypothetical protein
VAGGVADVDGQDVDGQVGGEVRLGGVAGVEEEPADALGDAGGVEVAHLARPGQYTLTRSLADDTTTPDDSGIDDPGDPPDAQT